MRRSGWKDAVVVPKQKNEHTENCVTTTIMKLDWYDQILFFNLQKGSKDVIESIYLIVVTLHAGPDDSFLIYCRIHCLVSLHYNIA